MAMRILWPNVPAEFVPVVREAVGPGSETEHCAAFPDVTDAQWAKADAIVGSCPPPQYIDKLRKCRIFVKLGVGYDDADLAIALMLTLAKSIAYHDAELRADLRANWRPA